jgi:hypothetical protein
VTPAPAPAASPSITFAPQAPVVQTAPPPAPPPESVRNPALEPRAAARRAAPRPAARAERVAPASAPIAAPVAAAVSAAPAIPAVAPSPEITPPPAAPEAQQPAVSAAPAAPAEEMSSGAAWAMLGLFAAAIIGAIAFLVARRRRRSADTFDYDEPVYEQEPATVAIEQPAAAAPLLAPAAVVTVASETAARPWIDIGLRPIGADEALDLEVTVSNSGDAPAHDVRVSTWMLAGGQSSDAEAALIEARSGAQVATLDVAEGDDASVGTRLALPDRGGTPILVAEARYPLPQGGEGRIAATFEIEIDEGAVEARLHEVVERA